MWEDPSLNDWPDDDFRLFCGDLGNDVTDELLVIIFSINFLSTKHVLCNKIDFAESDLQQI